MCITRKYRQDCTKTQAISSCKNVLKQLIGEIKLRFMLCAWYGEAPGPQYPM
jgi:hypothetical protein